MAPADETPAELAETFAQVARSLVAEPDVQHTLQRIVDLAVETLDGCDHAGISLVEGRSISTPAASNDVPGTVDAIQYETDQGPCLDAIRRQEVFQVDCLSEDQRWPDFSPRAARETGVESMLSFRLFVDEDTMGALNLYSRRDGAFDEEAGAIGSVFAAHAAVALTTAQHEEQLEQAIASRDVIGQAKGILMAREGVTADQAFDMLTRASQRLNVKLRDLAEGVTYTGEAPAEDA